MMRRPDLFSLATATTLAVACVDDPTSVLSPEGSGPRLQVAPVVVTRVALPGSTCCHVAANPSLNKIYVSGGASVGQQVAVIDGNTFALTVVGLGSGASVDPVSNQYWAAIVSPPGALVRDGTTNAVVGDIPLGFCPINTDVDPNLRRGWVGAQCFDRVIAIDATTFAVIREVPIGGVMGDIIVNPATGRLYLTSSGVSKRIHPVTFALTNNAFGSVVGVNDVTNRLYAVIANGLQVLNAAPDPETHLAIVPLGFTPNAKIGVNTLRSRLYVSNPAGNSVVIVDGSTNMAVGTIPLGAGVSPDFIDVDPTRNRVYVLATESGQRWLYVIEDGPSTAHTLTLTPPTATNPVGTKHTVTAELRDATGRPAPGVGIIFTVTGAHSENGSCTTDANGQCSFGYTGTQVGADVINAWADVNGDGRQDVDEPTAKAEKTWIAPAPATLVLEPPTATNPVGTAHQVTAHVMDALGQPVPGVIVRFTVRGAHNFDFSCTTDVNGQCTLAYAGTQPGTDIIEAYADANGDGVQDPNEPAAAANKIWTPLAPATLELEPKAAINTVDTRHCVTATVRDASGNPVPDIIVRFEVRGAVNTNGSATTDANGQATFCYQGPPLPGADVITAFADTDNDGTQDADEPGDAATKTWVLPPTTPLCEIMISNGGRITAMNGDKATFGGNARSSETGATQGEEEYQDHGPVQPLNMHSISVLAIVCDGLGAEASIYGDATIDGMGMYPYRIKVRDRGEPGAGRDTYWILLGNGYNSGDQTLEGGNVQIHRKD